MVSLSLIQSNTQIIVNNGKNTSFWDDCWCTAIPLKLKYPNLWKICRSKQATISEIVSFVHSQSAWSLGFSRNLKEVEVNEAAQLLDNIGNPELNEDQEDSRVWLPSKTGNYSSKSCYEIQYINEQNTTEKFTKSKLIWNEVVPTKVSFFIWSTLWNAAPTMDNLVRRGVLPPLTNQACNFCGSCQETTNHLLHHCSYSYTVWAYFLEFPNVLSVVPSSTAVCLNTWRRKWEDERHHFIWNNLPYAIWWALWLERNRRRFHNTSESAANTIIIVKALLYQWALPTQMFKGLFFEDLVHKWAQKIYNMHL
ncbi:uncharacterized protein LOC113294280 [Papaver somniferum]|uniref:uncharacterized protein LOC113294280 n=1 Tax=Papaver somniferum TaxID=3469 RepID=UPI000E7057D3|nr:uncharacterized protein LOC113294280 [Papaver somniferum]